MYCSGHVNKLTSRNKSQSSQSIRRTFKKGIGAGAQTDSQARRPTDRQTDQEIQSSIFNRGQGSLNVNQCAIN